MVAFEVSTWGALALGKRSSRGRGELQLVLESAGRTQYDGIVGGWRRPVSSSEGLKMRFDSCVRILSVACWLVITPSAWAGTIEPCPAGQFGLNGVPPCMDCAPGTFADTAGSTSCTPCPPGEFQSLPGSVQCNLCPSDTFAANPGTVTCDDCPEGTTSDPGASECRSAVPTVSEWGLVLMLLLAMGAGTTVFAKRQRQPA